jgi:hypothetical protein
MVYQGTIHNGVVVFENGVQLPEGTPVRVELIRKEKPQEKQSPKDDIVFRMGEYAIETGIPDLATNVDHYLYGHPKVADDK